MTRSKNGISPEVARKLAAVAEEIREIVYGDEAFPEWGTRFAQIEDQGMDIGLELGRLFMEQSVLEQAKHTPDDALQNDGETASLDEKHPLPSKLETPAGEVQWNQPKTRLAKARRDFFPSGQSTRD
ncbi:MAG: hypothetical protein O3A00_13345 [Planctomycetota bacterium]|nr:hypothetical protein [Planctomycetota bacterium]